MKVTALRLRHLCVCGKSDIRILTKLFVKRFS